MNNLRKKRRCRDISQIELSVRIGVPQSTISLIENGFIDPSEDLIKRIAKVLGCKEHEIFPKK